MKTCRFWGMGIVLACGTTAALAAEPVDQDRAYAAELLAQSQTATSAAPSTGAFKITDGSGNYVLQIGGYTQFRYVMNWRDDPASPNPVTGAHDSGFTSGFENARTRVNFSGNVINPDLKYRIEGSFSDEDLGGGGGFTLFDAFGRYNFNNGMYLMWGQFTGALLREDIVDSPYQLSVDRSMMDTVFAQGWMQGVEFGWFGDSVGFRADFTDGINTQNTSYSSSAEADWAITARVDIKFGGDWGRFDDFTSFRNSDGAGLLGIAGHYEQTGNTASTPAVATPQAGFFEYTADFAWEGNGWNVYVAGVGTHTEPDQGDGFDDFGALAQAGVFLTEQLELFGRVDAIFPDDDRAGLDEDLWTIGGGINYYVSPESHAAKFTADVQWFVNSPSENALVSDGAFGAQALQPSDNDDQFALRLQFQLMF